MHYPFKILKKHLENEYKWLGYEGIASADIKIREGVRMAKERIPQLEQAIEQLDMHEAKPKRQKEIDSQLNLFA